MIYEKLHTYTAGAGVRILGEMCCWLILMAMIDMGLVANGKSLLKRGAMAAIAGIVIYGILSLGSLFIIRNWF